MTGAFYKELMPGFRIFMTRLGGVSADGKEIVIYDDYPKQRGKVAPWKLYNDKEAILYMAIDVCGATLGHYVVEGTDGCKVYTRESDPEFVQSLYQDIAPFAADEVMRIFPHKASRKRPEIKAVNKTDHLLLIDTETTGLGPGTPSCSLIAVAWQIIDKKGAPVSDMKYAVVIPGPLRAIGRDRKER